MSKKKSTIARWATIICALVILDYLFEFHLFDKVNQSPLSIETIEGTGQAYHPSVMYFEKAWSGYHYWMAESPYPIGAQPYRDRWECPSIHVSNDGLHWQTPKGLTNPIDDLLPSEIQNRDFFSDPHLVFKDGQLECFYRYSEKTNDGYHTSLVRKTSHDGILWKERELLLDFLNPACIDSVGDMVRSPAILWQNNRYRMWYVDNADPNGAKQVCYSESFDGKQWSEAKTCTLEGYPINPWHLDLALLDEDYVLTLYDLHDLTLWKSDDGISFVYSKTLLSPSGISGCFYSDGLYRSSLIKDPEGYKLYFSAYDDRQTRIGLMEGNNMEALQVVSVNGPNKTLLGFFKPFMMIWKVRLWRAKQYLLGIIPS